MYILTNICVHTIDMQYALGLKSLPRATATPAKGRANIGREIRKERSSGRWGERWRAKERDG